MIELNDSPVLELEQNILDAFRSIQKDLDQAIECGKLNRELRLDIDGVSPRTPKVRLENLNEPAEVCVHVPHLELLWAFIYSWMVIYEETVQKAQLNGLSVGDISHENQRIVGRAYELWQWAKQLSLSYTPWPPNLPSPRHQQTASERWYVGKANFVFEQAVAFLLSHELAHITQGHLGSAGQDEMPASYAVRLEYEADQHAFNALVDPMRDDDEKAAEAWALVSVMLSSLFTTPDPIRTIRSRRHPPLHHRLANLMRSLNFRSDGYRYYFPFLARIVLQEAFPLLARPGQRHDDAEDSLNAALDDLDQMKGSGQVTEHG